jgi:hypothetical protein
MDIIGRDVCVCKTGALVICSDIIDMDNYDLDFITQLRFDAEDLLNLKGLS